MPKRTDIKKIMVIGSGPIIIGQACEFDYSGTQAIKALKEEGYEVVLVNSNPATIMTDPSLADRTYIEPIEPETVAAIIRKERPCALLPNLGGQTALNTSLALARMGVLAECGVELLGVDKDAIEKAESRELFGDCMARIGLKMPKSGIARNMEDVRKLGEVMPFPLIIRPGFTMGGSGGGVAYNMEDLEALAQSGLAASPSNEIMIEQSVLGWKELEMEVIRDHADNMIIICSIENIDPMGVHTGDSITVAPAQTLTLPEYQDLVDACRAIMFEVGVKGSGANVQFAQNPANGELVVIEMNPRVSRSSALASKATGVPIAKITAKLAVGYTLDEIKNDLTGTTYAAFEPSIDYVVMKMPRFTFEKFPGSKDELTTSMRSVGEAMSIGRTFKEAFQKGLRSLELGLGGFGDNFRAPICTDVQELIPHLVVPNSRRLLYIREAMLAGMSVETIFSHTFIDPWFLREMEELVQTEALLRDFALANSMTPDNLEFSNLMKKAKAYGYSDKQLANMWKLPESDVRRLRNELGVKPTYYLVDTCSGEFKSSKPYYYSTYETGSEIKTDGDRKVIILGGGPNRIGQGIEFDYCCCHASFALKDMGATAIMVNSNPETVSTDYDTSSRLYFEPLTFEDVMNIIDLEKPEGVIVQFGGQTPLNLAVPLLRAGVPILGTSPDSIDRAEDRERFQALVQKLKLRQPENAIVHSLVEAVKACNSVGYPIVIRPSYVLGGRAMEVVYDEAQLKDYFTRTLGTAEPEHPILIDKFLKDAIEVDVDALSDGKDTYVAGIMEHIEEAGIHSGDSACVLPPHSLSQNIIDEISRQTVALALELKVIGLMNIQFAVQDETVFILEVNPRASRTAPFVSKATAVPLPRLATEIMMGKTLKELDPWSMRKGGFVSVKEVVLPFNRFPGVDILLGPEMRSTGEVMGLGTNFGQAFMKAQLATNQRLPNSGKVFISVNENDKAHVVEIARAFILLGFEVLATTGTAALLAEHKIPVTAVNKVNEARPNIVDHIKNNQIAMVVNTASVKRSAINDSKAIRQATLFYGIPYSTTIAGARAILESMNEMREAKTIEVKCLQEYYKSV